MFYHSLCEDAVQFWIFLAKLHNLEHSQIFGKLKGDLIPAHCKKIQITPLFWVMKEKNPVKRRGAHFLPLGLQQAVKAVPYLQKERTI